MNDKKFNDLIFFLAFFYFGESLTGIMICMAAIGMVRSYLFVPQPLVVVENYPVEMYTACYGIFTLVNGIVIIIFGPLVGKIKYNEELIMFKLKIK